ncbi:MAG: hypothetical protein V9G12_07000 [Microthrixaceae bacterium]
MNPGLSALVVHDLKNRLAVHAQHLAEAQAAHPRSTPSCARCATTSTRCSAG